MSESVKEELPCVTMTSGEIVRFNSWTYFGKLNWLKQVKGSPSKSKTLTFKREIIGMFVDLFIPKSSYD